MDIIIRQLNTMGFAHVDGAVMRDELLHYGATKEDLDNFKGHWEQLGDDPNYHFRKTTQTRLSIAEDFSSIDRLEPAPFSLSYNNNTLLPDVPRSFPEADEAFVHDTAHQACLRLVRQLKKRISNGSSEAPSWSMMSSHQFRIQIKPEVREVAEGETPEGSEKDSPTPEGIHQDGADLVFIIFVDRANLLSRSGESRVYKEEQKSGVLTSYTEEVARRNTRLAEKNLSTPFEMLIFNDRKVKHDNRPIFAADPSKIAHRDVLVIWARSATNEDVEGPRGPHDSPLTLNRFPEDI